MIASRIVRLLLALILTLWAHPKKATAAGVVTDCANDSQLSAMLALGGEITFNCGTATIIISATRTITQPAIIDGGGKITLSGQNARQLFFVNLGASLELKNIALTNGFSANNGGAIHNNGRLTLVNTTIRNSNTDPSFSGGAIVTFGETIIQDSLFENNTGGNGGALYPRFPNAKVTITNSIFRNNAAIAPTGAGGAILTWDGASVELVGSEISNNRAVDGGGIFNTSNSTVTIKNSRVRNNTSSGAASFQITRGGGGIQNRGTLRLQEVEITGNQAQDIGGGVYNRNQMEIHQVLFSGNQARLGGGLAAYASMNITSATFHRNTADYGGGIYLDEGDYIITNTTLVENNGQGGGLMSAGFDNNVFVRYSTFANNTSPHEFWGHHIHEEDALLFRMQNTVLSGSQPGSCAGIAAGPSHITSLGFNLASDDTCQLTAAGDRPNTNAMLGALQSNGGFTPTLLPQPGSPLIDGGQCVAGVPADQRGASRLNAGAACDIGALEVQHKDLFVLEPVFLPLIMKP